jgi:cephalosporin hydroxylase
VGIDIEPAAAEHAGGRIEVFVGSQADEPFLSSVLERTGPPDLVIDDGSHQAPHQLATLQVMWPKLKEGGLYIVEDTQTSYHAGYDMGWRMPGSTIEILKDFVDDVHHRAHDGPIGLEGIEFVHFYHGTCVLKKRDPATKQTFTQRLDAASARASGAWTG